MDTSCYGKSKKSGECSTSEWGMAMTLAIKIDEATYHGILKEGMHKIGAFFCTYLLS